MALSQHAQKELDAFFELINPIANAYSNCTLGYVALKRDDGFEIVHARLLLQTGPASCSPFQVSTEHVRAGVSQAANPLAVIKQFLSGRISIDHLDLGFLPGESRDYSVYFDRHFDSGIQPELRRARLVVSGGRHHRFLDRRNLDWELRAASVPFDGLEDLCGECLVGLPNLEQAAFEVIAVNVARIAPASVVSGEDAKLVLHLATGLDVERAAIGFRLITRNGVANRGSISGNSMTWNHQGPYRRGEAEIKVPVGALVHCIATYASEVQHQAWLSDPATALNPLRVVHLAFDDEFEALTDLTKPFGKKEKDAREFETAVSWILWMLGFTTTHIGGTARTADAPDLIAATQSGHFAVIECTSGLLKADNKLPTLLARTEKVRQRLIGSGNPHPRVLPIIVTTMTYEEVKADLEQAAKLGVLVIARDKFVEIVERTLVSPNADQLYAAAEEHLKQRQSSFKTDADRLRLT